MRSRFLPHFTAARELFLLGGAVFCFAGLARGQEEVPTADSPNGWQRYDWLKPAEDQQRQADTTVKANFSQDIKDPFTTVANDSILQEKVGAAYTKRLDDLFSLSCETSGVTVDDGSEDIYRGQKASLQFQPSPDYTLSENVHGSTSDDGVPGESYVTTGAGVWAQGKLPFDAKLTLGGNWDRSGTDDNSVAVTTDNAYDAQVEKPLGSLPLTAVVKGHYEETSTAGALVSRMPSLEQSLVWKPVEDTTVQFGVRQQQYQSYPGVDSQFNAALFADLSQHVIGDVNWHTYAEMVNSRSLIDQAPAAPIASGAYGTQQATPPGSTPSLTSSLPVSLDDQAVTFSTGPSFRLQKDISASVEYSNRWDKDPASGGPGNEQRVSVSVKGSF